MFKKLFLVLLAAALIMPASLTAGKITIEEVLSVLDGYGHTSGQFHDVIVTIQESHPKYTTDKIGDLIIKSYYEVRESNPGISLYDAADGVKRFAQDRIGLDLKDLVVSYIESQLKDQE